MIKGLHVTYFTRHADQMREFMKNTLGFAFTDVGHGWLIFDIPNSEFAAHPTDENGEDDDDNGDAGGGGAAKPEGSYPEISFYCDDLDGTMRALKAKGVQFVGEVEDEGWGLIARFRMTDDVEVDLYQPRYARKPTRAAAAATTRSSKPKRAAKPAKAKSTQRRATGKKTR